jgi:nucleoside-diphosphate-sugar epimerase
MVACMEEVSRRADRDREQALVVPKPLPPARVLLTGASGFLGTAVLSGLAAREPAVRALVRKPLASPPGNVYSVCGDLGNPEVVDAAVEGVEEVYHVGAAMKGGAGDFERGTVAGTRNIVAACLRHGVKRLIYVSSLSVLDHAGHREGTPVAEDAPYEPYPERRGCYSQTKLEAERIVLEAIREQGLAAVVLRPGQVFGPGAETVPPAGVIGMGGRWVIAGSGRHRLPLVYVDDVADAVLLAARNDDAAGKVFHLVDPEKITQGEYVEAALRKLRGRLKVQRVPYWFLLLAAFGVEMLGRVLGRSVGLSRYRIRSLRPLGPFEPGAARQVLGWEPRVGVREGLLRTFGSLTPGRSPK